MRVADLFVMDRYNNLKQRWTVVVLNDKNINAFVTDIVPRTIFVHAQVRVNLANRCRAAFCCDSPLVVLQFTSNGVTIHL